MTLESFDSVGCAISSDIVISLLQQHVFPALPYGPTDPNLFSVVLDRGDENAFWVAMALVLFHLPIVSRHPRELSFVQYFEITLPFDAIDGALRCLCLI